MRWPHADQKNNQAQTIVAETASDCQIRSQSNQAPAAQWMIGRNRCQVSDFSPAAGKKTARLIEKETNSSPQSLQKTLRKKILNNLCALRVLCGEILLENNIGFHKVSYKVSETRD
jgi:hypothetical protein